MPRKMRMKTLLERYKKKLVKVLNDSLVWNNVKLPNNTLELQIKKYCEEVDEAIEAEGNYQMFIEELADVLITIGGVMRFNEELAVSMLNEYLSTIDKYVFMDVIDYAERKIPMLYKRSYLNGFHHEEIIQ